MSNDTAGVLAALVVGFALGLIVTWIYWLQRERKGAPMASEAVEAERLPLEPGLETLEAQPSAELEPEPDDLTRVEGIGPKISAVLAEEGVTRFEQLAERDAQVLKEILRSEGLQFVDPTTWPEQAALAAVGAWAALEELQEQLSGGRRVG